MQVNAHSHENRHEIHLIPEEKFKAFKSWVAGISEAGIDTFKIQAEIEKMSKFVSPISLRLLKFVNKHSRDFMYFYMERMM